jgi:hypothetical protein
MSMPRKLAWSGASSIPGSNTGVNTGFVRRARRAARQEQGGYPRASACGCGQSPSRGAGRAAPCGCSAKGGLLRMRAGGQGNFRLCGKRLQPHQELLRRFRRKGGPLANARLGPGRLVRHGKRRHEERPQRFRLEDDPLPLCACALGAWATAFAAAISEAASAIEAASAVYARRGQSDFGLCAHGAN